MAKKIELTTQQQSALLLGGAAVLGTYAFFNIARNVSGEGPDNPWYKALKFAIMPVPFQAYELWYRASGRGN